MDVVRQLTAEVSVDEGGGRIVRLAGELDLATRQQAATALTCACRDTGGSAVVVDLSALTFIDAAGIGTLVRTRNRSSQEGVRMSVEGARGVVARVLGLCGFTDAAETIVPVTDTVTGSATDTVTDTVTERTGPERPA